LESFDQMNFKVHSLIILIKYSYDEDKILDILFLKQ
jgi:hypothetical protein